MFVSVLQEVLDLAFSITYDVEEYSLNFIAPSRTDVSVVLKVLSPQKFQMAVYSFLHAVSYTVRI